MANWNIRISNQVLAYDKKRHAVSGFTCAHSLPFSNPSAPKLK